MSISAEKLSEIISAYQRISAYTTLGGSPAVLHGYMMAPPVNGTVNTSSLILPTTATQTRCATTSVQQQPQQQSNQAVSSSANETPQLVRPVALIAGRPSVPCRRDSISSSSVGLEQDENEVEMMQFEGDAIPAFAVGGERRLYMPMLLRRLLHRGFNDRAIQTACEELKIHFQEASDEQMDALRRTLQAEVPRCGLIKRSDAERLWALLDQSDGRVDKQSDGLTCQQSTTPSQATSSCEQACSSAGTSHAASGTSSPANGSYRFAELPTANSFQVYHACFGKQKGVFVPEWYTAPDARCVVCMRCGVHCSPERFVTHVHRATAENNVAHWGFDPAKWRAYLLLSKDQHASKELRDYFESLKCKFDASRKRKVCSVAPTPACSTLRPTASPETLNCVKKARTDTEVEHTQQTTARPQQTDFRQVPANFTLPAESVTIAQAALASARATTSANETNGCANTTSNNGTATLHSSSNALPTQSQRTNTPVDGTVSAMFVRELQALQEAQERELKTLRDLVDGRTLSASEADDFLSEAAALRRRQFSLLSGVMYENVLLKQQVKTTKESSERALAAFAAENSALRGERRKIDDDLARLRNECARLRNELDERERITIAANALACLNGSVLEESTDSESCTNELHALVVCKTESLNELVTESDANEIAAVASQSTVNDPC